VVVSLAFDLSGIRFLTVVSVLTDVQLTTDNGFDPGGLGRAVKFVGPEDIAMVGHGNSGHSETRTLAHQFFRFAGAIQKGKMCV